MEERLAIIQTETSGPERSLIEPTHFELQERKTMKSSITAHEKANLAFLGMLGIFIVTLLYGVFAMGIR